MFNFYEKDINNIVKSDRDKETKEDIKDTFTKTKFYENLFKDKFNNKDQGLRNQFDDNKDSYVNLNLNNNCKPKMNI